jgi:cell division initiation protein
MPLSPIDVQQQTFKVALRGYAEDEVDEFLDEVVISLRDYEQRVRDAQERIAVLEEQLAANRETEDAMRRTFLAAQRTADSIVEEAKAESERILGDARGEVDRVTFEQTEQKAQLLAETALLRDRVHGLRASLTELAGGTLDRLAQIDTDAVVDRIKSSVAPVADLREIEQAEQLRLDEEDFAVDEYAPLPAEEIAANEHEDEGTNLADLGDEVTDEVDESVDDVEIAKVPDWITGEGSATEESQHQYRRPWERDDG